MSETLRVYRARQDLGSGAQRAITAGKLYRIRATEAGRVLINDLGQEHLWPFFEDFGAYFELANEEERRAADKRADLLADIYSLILSWSDPGPEEEG